MTNRIKAMAVYRERMQNNLDLRFRLSSSSLETATSGTQEKRLPLLPSGPDGVHIHLLRRAVPRLQKDRMAERVGVEPTVRD